MRELRNKTEIFFLRVKSFIIRKLAGHSLPDPDAFLTPKEKAEGFSLKKWDSEQQTTDLKIIEGNLKALSKTLAFAREYVSSFTNTTNFIHLFLMRYENPDLFLRHLQNLKIDPDLKKTFIEVIKQNRLTYLPKK